MKRPGKLLKPTKLSDIKDTVESLSKGQIIYNTIKKYQPIGMMKIAFIANMRPRTVRNYLAEMISENKITKTECMQCGTHTAYKIS